MISFCYFKFGFNCFDSSFVKIHGRCLEVNIRGCFIYDFIVFVVGNFIWDVLIANFVVCVRFLYFFIKLFEFI